MDHIAGVNVAEALRDVGQLVTGINVGQVQQEVHPQVRVGLLRGVS